MTTSSTAPLLEVENLCVEVTVVGGKKTEPALRDVSFSVAAGEAVGLVGESGSGKSLTLRTLLGILPAGIKATSGRVLFEGVDLLKAPKRTVNALRGTGITMIFQEPMTSLNPIAKVGEQIIDAARAKHSWSKADARDHALRLAKQMGIPDPENVLSLYPHELSGGLRQRVMIAAALACQPKLVLCDEPTTALDVTIQAQIIQLLAKLKDELGMSMLYVTHDLAVVAQLCQRLEVMYAGSIVESGSVAEVFRKPNHPYTQGLVNATPDVDDVVTDLAGIRGNAPTLGNWPEGCAFHPRCDYASDECRSGEFPLQDVGEGRKSACIHIDALHRAIENAGVR
ncbi:MAG TPA: ABC transporter ATP-binding protein [Acidimicrobiales bacterium]|nr:ABC transporter ATP-binding protein [Acidimicrobiales bacterium]